MGIASCASALSPCAYQPANAMSAPGKKPVRRSHLAAHTTWFRGPRKGGGHFSGWFRHHDKREPKLDADGNVIPPHWDPESVSAGSGMSRYLCCVLPPKAVARLSPRNKPSSRASKPTPRGVGAGLGEGLMDNTDVEYTLPPNEKTLL